MRLTDLQEVKRSNNSVVILSMFRRNTLDLNSALDFVTSKLPTWAKFTARF